MTVPASSVGCGASVGEGIEVGVGGMGVEVGVGEGRSVGAGVSVGATVTRVGIGVQATMKLIKSIKIKLIGTMRGVLYIIQRSQMSRGKCGSIFSQSRRLFCP
jgi:hypothetical protein